MDNNNKNLSDAAAMAQFRLALIAPVIHGVERHFKCSSDCAVAAN